MLLKPARRIALTAAVLLFVISVGLRGQTQARPVVAPDESADVALVRGLAEKGAASEQFKMGWRYENGRGVPQDYSQAAEWYRKSADRGYPDAMSSLGTLYATGKGVRQDGVEAQTWLNLAVARAFPAEQTKYREKRDAFAKTLSPGQIAEAQARMAAWLQSYNKR